MESHPEQDKCCAFFLSCVLDGIEMSMLSTTLKNAVAFRAIELALREGSHACAAKRTEEQTVVVPVVQLKEHSAKVSAEKQIVDVFVLLFQETDEVRMATPQERTSEGIFEPIVFDPCFS